MCHRVLCYGDSNTYGFDPRGNLADRYPVEIRWTGRLEANGWQIRNAGENGRPIPQHSCEIEAAANQIRRWKPDLTTIMLGTNDLLQDPNLSARSCAARMERFLGVLLHQCPSCKMLLIAPPPLTRGAWVTAQKLVETSQCLGAFYRETVRTLGIDFADAGAWGIELAYDGVHFSERGHLAFADAMQKVLNGLLQGRAVVEKG